MKIDPYKHKEKYFKWKEKVRNGLPNLCKKNSDVILQYISDMENGLNVSSKSVKGPRSYIRLNNLQQRLVSLAKQIKEYSGVALTDITEEQLFRFFSAMRNGEVSRKDGGTYQSVVDYVKPFKAFWHWHMKVNKKKGVMVRDITEDLDASKPKPRWVYLTEEDVRKLCDHARPQYRVLMMFI